MLLLAGSVLGAPATPPTVTDADIERAVIYTFHSVIAERWRQGRIFLAGDAAHQTPPFLGQGMCAAIRDAANLAWKLEAVLRGRADDALLETYASERAPHVQAFIELAVRLGDIIQTTDPQAARERDARFKAGQPEIFHFPAPRLGPGVWQGEHPQVAQIFPQPTLPDGRALDAVVGLNFALIAEPALLASAASSERWAGLGVRCVPAQGALSEWLNTQGVRAVLLRPDRYILGVAETADELDSLATQLPQASALAHTEAKRPANPRAAANKPAHPEPRFQNNSNGDEAIRRLRQSGSLPTLLPLP